MSTKVISGPTLLLLLFWTLLAVEDVRSREVHTAVIVLVSISSLALLPISDLTRFTTPIYIAGMIWTVRNSSIKLGDSFMLVGYAASTINQPLNGLAALLLCSGLYIIALGQLDLDDVPFAPVFLLAYLLAHLL